MIQESRQVLSYRGAATRPSRFRHVKAIFPFFGGLILGAVVASWILAAAPQFADPMLGVLVFYCGLVVIAVYSVVVLLLIGCFSSRILCQRPWLLSMALGVGVPLLGMGMWVTAATVSVVLSPPPWLVDCFEVVLWVLFGVAALGVPFLLAQSEDQPPQELARRQERLLLKKIVVVAALFGLMMGVGRWAAEKKFDRECASLARQVKNSHSVPGTYLAILLPKSQDLLSVDHQVDAVVLPDGRVIIMLKASLGWKGSWTGTLYASGPIAASEIGIDAYGRPQIHVTGLPEHFVVKQVDAQHFIVAFDLG